MAAELSDEQRKRKYELQTTWYNNLTAEQKAARNKRAVELQRIRRARWKEAGLTSAGKARVRVLRRSKPAPAVVTPANPQKAVESAPARSAKQVKAQNLTDYDSVSAQKAQALQRVWRAEVGEYLLTALTAPESPFTGAGMRTSQMLCYWYGLGDKLDRIVEKDKPEMTQEFTLAVLLECLRRLSGEKPSVSIPVLPGRI
jgi:hypothetical protein